MPLRTPFSAIVFDLDGTLIDSFQDIVVACNVSLGKIGREPLAPSLIRTFVGRGSRRLLASALALDIDDECVSEALAHFLDYYEAHPADHTAPRPGAEQLLDSLSALPVAICTNKPARLTTQVMRALGWQKRFSVVIAGGDAEALKPDPRPLALACARLGVAPSQAAMIGDGPEDVLSAKASGAFAVAVLGGFPAEERVRAAEPDLVVPDLFAFARYLSSPA